MVHKSKDWKEIPKNYNSFPQIVTPTQLHDLIETFGSEQDDDFPVQNSCPPSIGFACQSIKKCDVVGQVATSLPTHLP
jgi:hypothetical protein